MLDADRCSPRKLNVDRTGRRCWFWTYRRRQRNTGLKTGCGNHHRQQRGRGLSGVHQPAVAIASSRRSAGSQLSWNGLLWVALRSCVSNDARLNLVPLGLHWSGERRERAIALRLAIALCCVRRSGGPCGLMGSMRRDGLRPAVCCDKSSQPRNSSQEHQLAGGGFGRDCGRDCDGGR